MSTSPRFVLTTDNVRQPHKEFSIHLAAYVIASASLLAINILRDRDLDNFWFFWVLFGWGIILMVHALWDSQVVAMKVEPLKTATGLRRRKAGQPSPTV